MEVVKGRASLERNPGIWKAIIAMRRARTLVNVVSSSFDGIERFPVHSDALYMPEAQARTFVAAAMWLEKVGCAANRSRHRQCRPEILTEPHLCAALCFFDYGISHLAFAPL